VESVGKKLRKYSGLMENDAGVEIHKKRGFPHPLETVTPKPVRLFHISHKPYDEFLRTFF